MLYRAYGGPRSLNDERVVVEPLGRGPLGHEGGLAGGDVHHFDFPRVVVVLEVGVGDPRAVGRPVQFKLRRTADLGHEGGLARGDVHYEDLVVVVVVGDPRAVRRPPRSIRSTADQHAQVRPIGVRDADPATEPAARHGER